MHPKLSIELLKRRAVVYIRQSSPGQVVHNLESHAARSANFRITDHPGGSPRASRPRHTVDRSELLPFGALPIVGPPAQLRALVLRRLADSGSHVAALFPPMRGATFGSASTSTGSGRAKQFHHLDAAPRLGHQMRDLQK